MMSTSIRLRMRMRMRRRMRMERRNVQSCFPAGDAEIAQMWRCGWPRRGNIISYGVVHNSIFSRRDVKKVVIITGVTNTVNVLTGNSRYKNTYSTYG